MTDYDSIRTCCSEANICRLCWSFISAAVQVLHQALTVQFGFKHLLWVYSGRRGIHLWIGDKEAMELDDAGRKAIVGWLEVIKGGKEMGKKVNVRLGPGKFTPGELPPSIKTALQPLAMLFSTLILTDQNCFGSEKGYETLLQLIPDRAIVNELRTKWEADPERDSVDKWADLKAEVKRTEKDSAARVRLTASFVLSVALICRVAESNRGSNGRHYPAVYISSYRCRGLKTPKPFTQSAFLYSSKDRSCLCSRGPRAGRRV